MTYGPLVIGIDYPDDILKRNRALVVFIVKRYDNKIVKTTVVERDALPDWFVTTKAIYSQDAYRYILSATSIVGEIVTLLEDKDTQNLQQGRAN